MAKVLSNETSQDEIAVRQLCVKRFTEVADETKSTYCDILFTAVRNMKLTKNDKEKHNL